MRRAVRVTQMGRKQAPGYMAALHRQYLRNSVT